MTVLPIHIAGGIFALLFGYVALAVRKGGVVHRNAGLGFVIAMAVMSLTGALIASLKPDRGSIVAGLLTFYFILTGFLTVRPSANSRKVERVAMVFVAVLALLAAAAGVWLARRGRVEAPPMFLFSAMAMTAAIGDFRMIRAGGIEGKRRIKRHLWRLCFAMWVAAASFFWGPAGRVPEVIRIPVLLPIPVLIPIVVMFFWLWRMRRRATSAAGLLSHQSAEVAS